MNAKQKIGRSTIGAIVVLAIVFQLTPAAGAQTAKAKPVTTTKAPSETQTSGPQEGIKVHGHWVIEVRNPDGSLASRTEFENALTPTGNGFLGRLLTRGILLADWQVHVGGSAGPCVLAAVNGTSACVMAEPSSTLSGSAVFKTLSVAFKPDAGADPTTGTGAIELKGNATAFFDSSIFGVETHVISACGTGVPQCTPTTFMFTQAGLAPANQQHVFPGQIVQVTVTLRFS